VDQEASILLAVKPSAAALQARSKAGKQAAAAAPVVNVTAGVLSEDRRAEEAPVMLLVMESMRGRGGWISIGWESDGSNAT